MRDSATPNGTDEGIQKLVPTPKGNNEAWQFIRRKGASAEEAKTQQEKDGQSVKNARKRAKKEQKRGYAVRQPLNQRALAAEIPSSKAWTDHFPKNNFRIRCVAQKSPLLS